MRRGLERDQAGGLMPQGRKKNRTGSNDPVEHLSFVKPSVKRHAVRELQFASESAHAIKLRTASRNLKLHVLPHLRERSNHPFQSLVFNETSHEEEHRTT